MLGQHPEGDVKMGIKIYTYSNPYELTQEMYWDENIDNEDDIYYNDDDVYYDEDYEYE